MKDRNSKEELKKEAARWVKEAKREAKLLEKFFNSIPKSK